MSQYFPKPYEAFGGDIKVKVDLSNYATKADIKNISHVDTSSFTLKTTLANLKTKVDKLDIDKLKPVLDDLSKLSNVVTNDVVKKTDYNAKITGIEGKIPDISNLSTKTALTTVENKIPDTRGLVKKTDYNAKITEIEYKIPDISDYFDEDGTQNYLVFLPIFRYFKVNVTTIVTNYVLSWKSKAFSDETVKAPSTSDNSLTLSINYINNTDKIRVNLLEAV